MYGTESGLDGWTILYILAGLAVFPFLQKYPAATVAAVWCVTVALMTYGLTHWR